MAKGLLDILIEEAIDAFWTDERKGAYGEKLTARELKWVKFFGRKGNTLRNVYLPKDDGETSEIDLVYITTKGIFVMESKNYSGWIFGDEKSAYWTASLPNGQKNRFYSPILQNKTHIKWLDNYLNQQGYQQVPMFSMIIFSERCEIKKMNVTSENIRVLKRDMIHAHVRDIWDKVPDVFTDEEIARITEILKSLTNVDVAIKEAHIQNINKKHNKSEAKKEDPDVQETTPTEDNQKAIEPAEPAKTIMEEKKVLCPKCGSELVLRVAKKGDKAGNRFYGCSRFPKCRYIKELEEE
ncbi:MAG: NERD domain-containing protein [Firmicutes bacterium]|nr:NERD domain-containing protein [Bacillota bacterium]